MYSQSDYHDCGASARVSKKIMLLCFGPLLHWRCGKPHHIDLFWSDINFMLTRLTSRLLFMFRKDKIIWECDNGGQLWTESAADGLDNGKSMPGGFCSAGFSSLYAAFIVSLLVDIGFQVCLGRAKH